MQAYFSGGRKLFVRYVVTAIFDFIHEKKLRKVEIAAQK